MYLIYRIKGYRFLLLRRRRRLLVVVIVVAVVDFDGSCSSTVLDDGWSPLGLFTTSVITKIRR